MVLVLSLSFITPSNAGEALDILKSLPPLEVDIPRMPQIDVSNVTIWEGAASCKNGILNSATFEIPVGESKVYAVVYNWFGTIPMIAYFTENWWVFSLWVDYDNDRIAEEYYHNMKHFEAVYGSRTHWFCQVIEKIESGNTFTIK